MSVEAISWALNLAPVPIDPNGKRNSSCAFVLVGLANHASPDGTGAFPAVATLMRYTSLSERTIRTSLDRLQELGVITPCAPEIIAARIKRADRRPQGWDLNMALLRDDLSEQEVKSLERQFPGLSHRLNGVQPLHPVESGQTGHGVQLTHARGATIAPKPSIEPSFKDQDPPYSPPGGDDRDGALFGAGHPAPPPVTKPGTRDEPGDFACFARFYDAYPRHVGKLSAQRAFLKALRTADAEAVIAGAVAFAGQCEREHREQRFIPHPGTWLNRGGWMDEEGEQPGPGESREVLYEQW